MSRIVFLVTKALHRGGFHGLCRSVSKRWELPVYRLADGTLWKPDINGVLPSTTYHTPR